MNQARIYNGEKTVSSIRGAWKTGQLQGFPVAQRLNRLPGMQETRVRSPGREDPLEKEMAPHSSILAWRIPMDRGAWWATVHEVARVRHH